MLALIKNLFKNQRFHKMNNDENARLTAIMENIVRNNGELVV